MAKKTKKRQGCCFNLCERKRCNRIVRKEGFCLVHYNMLLAYTQETMLAQVLKNTKLNSKFHIYGMTFKRTK